MCRHCDARHEMGYFHRFMPSSPPFDSFSFVLYLIHFFLTLERTYRNSMPYTDTDSLLSMGNIEICISTAKVTSKNSNNLHTHTIKNFFFKVSYWVSQWDAHAPKTVNPTCITHNACTHDSHHSYPRSEMYRSFGPTDAHSMIPKGDCLVLSVIQSKCHVWFCRTKKQSQNSSQWDRQKLKCKTVGKKQVTKSTITKI